MRAGTDKLLGKALRAVTAADTSLARGTVDLAAGRAYYAMLYAAKTVLNECGVRPRAHTRVQVAFRALVGEGSTLDAKLHAWLQEAYDMRMRSGSDEIGLTVTDVEQLVRRAREFVQEATRFAERTA